MKFSKINQSSQMKFSKHLYRSNTQIFLIFVILENFLKKKNLGILPKNWGLLGISAKYFDFSEGYL
jgi:hypothetical protein